MIEAKNLSYEFTQGHLLFSDVSFTLNGGEILVLLGPNGVGKTTLLNCMAGLLHAKSGQILLDGSDLSSLSIGQIAQLVGYLPQAQNVAFEFSVVDYLVMGRAPYLKFGASPGKKDYQKAYDTLESLKITHLANQPISRISGGERQQAQIGRVLMQDTKIILMDEPTNHLDYGNQIMVLKLIADLKNKGYSVLMTSHVPDHAILLESRVGVIERDLTFTLGNADDILTRSMLSALYAADIRVEHLENLDRSVCVPGNIFERD
jgi:iron complex transport system ATP-binding protein